VKGQHLTRTKQLIRLLGHHPDAAKGQLTLYELGALVIVAGTEAGFRVFSESPLALGLLDRNGRRRRESFDCVWFSTCHKPVVAWELDGQNVGDQHLKGTFHKVAGVRQVRRIGSIRKFGATGAPIRVQALYSIRGRLLPNRVRAVKDCYRGKGVQVLSDVQLIQGKFLKIVKTAIKAVRPLCARV
jgi:hypothetical protein